MIKEMKGKAPLRLTFAGGMTDVPSVYQIYGGQTISATIDKYVYVNLTPLPSTEPIEVITSKYKVVGMKNISDPILRAVINRTGIQNYRIEITSDIDAFGAGLGSSHAMILAFLRALPWPVNQEHKLTKDFQAEVAASIEIEDLERGTGKQDSYAISYGGCLRFDYHKNGKVIGESLEPPDSRYFLLFDTGTRRYASDLIKKHFTMNSQISMMHRANTEYFRMCLRNQDYKAIGILFSEMWRTKIESNPKATNQKIDEMHRAAIEAGAWGGKNTGVGRGFLVFIAPPSQHEAVISAVEENGGWHIPFRFEGC